LAISMGNHFQEEFVEEYLEALHRLDKGQGYVRNNQLSRQLEISPASVTEMIQRLADRGLVEYKRYYGARLTESGRERAARVHARHRMLELFLNQILGLEKEALHEAACKLEHALTPELESHIVKLVRHINPEGVDLPACPQSLDVSAPRLQLLEELATNGTATVRAVLIDNVSQRLLEDFKLTMGAKVTRTGPRLTFAVDQGQELTLDPELARRVLVEVL